MTLPELCKPVGWQPLSHIFLCICASMCISIQIGNKTVR